MITPEQIIQQARTYLGTPFVHQGRVPNVGLDCVGVVRAPLEELTGFAPDYLNYQRTPDPVMMRRLLGEHLHCVSPMPMYHDLQPADILWFVVEKDPQHLALFTERGTIIHAVAIPPQKVIEQRLTEEMYRKVIAVYRYKLGEQQL